MTFVDKYCDNSFINKPASLNFLPPLIQTIYRTGTAWFYRFACVIVAQAHISLMTRLFIGHDFEEVTFFFYSAVV